MKKITKYLIVFLTLILVVGCGNMTNTPTKKVETFLSKYQTQDKVVLDQLDEIIKKSGKMTDKQKEEYRDLMKKQYQNLSYKIKNEMEDGNKATVTVEIEVYDYGKALANAEDYLANNRSEFVTDTENDLIDTVKFLDYKIKKMDSTRDKVSYTINFTLTKKDGTWSLNDISDIDRLKLHGLYY